MIELTDENGVHLSFDWPTGPGAPPEAKVSIRITDGPASVSFELSMTACDHIRQRLQQVMEAPKRGERFEG